MLVFLSVIYFIIPSKKFAFLDVIVWHAKIEIPCSFSILRGGGWCRGHGCGSGAGLETQIWLFIGSGLSKSLLGRISLFLRVRFVFSFRESDPDPVNFKPPHAQLYVEGLQTFRTQTIRGKKNVWCSFLLFLARDFQQRFNQLL